MNKKAWVFTQLTWKLICFSDVRLLRGNCDCTLYNINKPFNFIDCRKHVCSLLVHVLHQFHTWMLCSWFRKKLHKQWALFLNRLSTPMFAINYDWIFEIEMVYKLSLKSSAHHRMVKAGKQISKYSASSLLGREEFPCSGYSLHCISLVISYLFIAIYRRLKLVENEFFILYLFILCLMNLFVCFLSIYYHLFVQVS